MLYKQMSEGPLVDTKPDTTNMRLEFFDHFRYNISIGLSISYCVSVTRVLALPTRQMIKYLYSIVMALTKQDEYTLVFRWIELYVRKFNMK